MAEERWSGGGEEVAGLEEVWVVSKVEKMDDKPNILTKSEQDITCRNRWYLCISREAISRKFASRLPKSLFTYHGRPAMAEETRNRKKKSQEKKEDKKMKMKKKKKKKK